MKGIFALLFLLVSVASQAQVQLKPDSSYVKDGALVLRFKLVNPTAQVLSLKTDKRNALQQLNKQEMSDALLADAPRNFIIFFLKEKMVDEQVSPCDFKLAQYEEITLQQGQEYSIVFLTHCLSETVLTQLNKGKALHYEMYIRYEESGTLKIVKTEKVKIKVKKPAF